MFRRSPLLFDINLNLLRRLWNPALPLYLFSGLHYLERVRETKHITWVSQNTVLYITLVDMHCQRSPLDGPIGPKHEYPDLAPQPVIVTTAMDPHLAGFQREYKYGFPLNLLHSLLFLCH